MPYDLEYGANRIALAYWREVDNKLCQSPRRALRRHPEVRDHSLPQGQDLEEYFNTNYDKLALTPAYAWFAPR